MSPPPVQADQNHGQADGHHNHEADMDLGDFYVYYTGEPVGEGFEIDMVEHMPTTIQEIYPKNGPDVTPEAIERYMSRLA